MTIPQYGTLWFESPGAAILLSELVQLKAELLLLATVSDTVTQAGSSLNPAQDMSGYVWISEKATATAGSK